MTRVIKAAVACLLLLCVQRTHSQDLYQIAAKWELRDNNNDPTIATSGYKKIRLKFSTTLSLSFTGTKGDPYPTTMLLERNYKFSGFYFLPLHLQVYKNGEWDRNTIDLQLTSWGEVLTRDEETLHTVYNDFLSGSKARIRVGMSGEDWYEVSLASFKTVAKGVFTAGQRTASVNQTSSTSSEIKPPNRTGSIKPPTSHKGGGIKPSTTKVQANSTSTKQERDQYGFPLVLGDKENKWVRILQRALLPESQWNGNYDAATQRAIAKYLVDENIAYDWGEGNVTTLDLYNDIVTKKFNFGGTQQNTTIGSAATTTTTTNSTNAATTAATTQAQATQLGSKVIKFPIHMGFGSSGDEVEQDVVLQLQYAVNAPRTKVLDKQTIDNIRAFVSDEQNKKIMGIDQPDSMDLRLLNDANDPALTRRLYNIVINLAEDLARQSGKVVK